MSDGSYFGVTSGDVYVAVTLIVSWLILKYGSGEPILLLYLAVIVVLSRLLAWLTEALEVDDASESELDK